MTKSDLRAALADKTGLPVNQCQQTIEDILDIMKSALESGEQIKISGFGGFTVKDKNPRRGRNPQTGDDLEISSRKVVRFKASPVLKRAMGDMG